jgi:hypothetical protein
MRVEGWRKAVVESSELLDDAGVSNRYRLSELRRYASASSEVHTGQGFSLIDYGAQDDEKFHLSAGFHNTKGSKSCQDLCPKMHSTISSTGLYRKAGVSYFSFPRRTMQIGKPSTLNLRQKMQVRNLIYSCLGLSLSLDVVIISVRTRR